MPDLLTAANSSKSQQNCHSRKQYLIPSDPTRVPSLRAQLEADLLRHRVDPREIFAIKLAFEEALINAIKHGNRLDQKKKVNFTYSISEDFVELFIEDEGNGFDPDDLPDPLAIENLERSCGRGVMLMKHYMSEVTIHAPGNMVSMRKHRNQSSVEK